MWTAPQQHPFSLIKVNSRIRLTAVASAMVAHNWKWLKHWNPISPILLETSEQKK